MSGADIESEDLKIEYVLLGGVYRSKAYVTMSSIEDNLATGVNKHTEEPVTVRWTGSEWIEVEANG